MPIIHDKEFGKITVRRNSNSRQVKMRVAPDGTLRATLPTYTPIFFVKYLLSNSRDEIRKIISQSKPEYEFKNGMQVGKSHTLVLTQTDKTNFSVKNCDQRIIVKIPHNMSLNDINISRKIRDAVISALRLEAKSYLPKRLSYLAIKFGYDYNKVRFSHASGRWGSCSGNGTISLNIALMKLQFELIDYVIVHELVHTKYMNHGPEFWAQVTLADPNYKEHRRLLKSLNPSI